MREWLRVYTYKAGLLSPMAHDLQISLSRWDLQPEGAYWLFQADAAHLQIDGPIVRGQLEQRGITDRDRRKIKGHIRDTILNTRAHPKKSRFGVDPMATFWRGSCGYGGRSKKSPLSSARWGLSSAEKWRFNLPDGVLLHSKPWAAPSNYKIGYESRSAFRDYDFDGLDRHLASIHAAHNVLEPIQNPSADCSITDSVIENDSLLRF